MRSPRPPFAWLLAKEWRELLASRAWWLMLAVIGPLVGWSFISASTVYAELSGAGGTADGVGEAFSPLVGIWAPTFSACELAAAFLLPFVAIRLVSGDRQSGALRIEHQHSLSSLARVSAKGMVLLAAWLIASLAPLIAVVLWKSYGGFVYLPELLTVIAGHLLNAGVAVALAVTAASIAEHPSTAAILTLVLTVGTWFINFAAAVNGGWWEQAAAYTPTAMVAEFQRGLLRADLMVAATALIAMGFAVAATWLRIGDTIARRLRVSLAVLGVGALALAGASALHPSWDTSENRQNSFSHADEAALATIHAPLKIQAYLAPEDPRRSDLELRALRKLKRALPQLQVQYISRTTVGLFEQTADHYGEIWYEFDDRKHMSRVTTAEGVLDAVYSVTHASAATQSEFEVFRGHPLETRPRGAPVIFYGLWPLTVTGIAIYFERRQS